MNIPKLADVIGSADLVHDRDALEDAIEDMADAICDDYEGDDTPPLFITIMHGGMPFAAQLAFALGERDLDVELEYLHATRYRGNNQGGELVWKHRPATALYGRRVLIADDILDEGHTLLAIQQHCQAEGAASVRIAVLAHKRHERRAPGIGADYIGLEVPDRYVFGYGMDWNGHGRNLPAIYALDAEA